MTEQYDVAFLINPNTTLKRFFEIKDGLKKMGLQLRNDTMVSETDYILIEGFTKTDFQIIENVTDLIPEINLSWDTMHDWIE